MQQLILLFSFMFSNTICCLKQRIRKALYNLNGTRISYEDSANACIGLFVINLIITDMIVRSHFITFILYILTSSHVPGIIIICVGNTINIGLILSLYSETKTLIKTINCKCDNDNELLREHVD
jgi:hypothetical protein